MIRTIPIPTRVNRMGLVQAGAGGSAASYSFDPATGLSNDPQLAYYLQDLTPAQLQTALDGGDPSNQLQVLLTQESTATGAGALPCGTAGNPTCGAAPTGLASIPAWAWLAGGAAVVALVATR